jgi:glycyl-tRNA synthetase (class II)
MSLGVDEKRLRFVEHEKDEMAHYATESPWQTFDIKHFAGISRSQPAFIQIS